MIVDEAGFLVEEKVHRIISSLDADQKNQVKIESIMKALGVETLENAEVLFIERVKRQVMLGYFIEDEEDQTLIHPNKVLDALKQFVWDFQAKQRGLLAKLMTRY